MSIIYYQISLIAFELNSQFNNFRKLSTVTTLLEERFNKYLNINVSNRLTESEQNAAFLFKSVKVITQNSLVFEFKQFFFFTFEYCELCLMLEINLNYIIPQCSCMMSLNKRGIPLRETHRRAAKDKASDEIVSFSFNSLM